MSCTARTDFLRLVHDAYAWTVGCCCIYHCRHFVATDVLHSAWRRRGSLPHQLRQAITRDRFYGACVSAGKALSCETCLDIKTGQVATVLMRRTCDSQATATLVTAVSLNVGRMRYFIGLAPRRFAVDLAASDIRTKAYSIENLYAGVHKPGAPSTSQRTPCFHTGSIVQVSTRTSASSHLANSSRLAPATRSAWVLYLARTVH